MCTEHSERDCSVFQLCHLPIKGLQFINEKDNSSKICFLGTMCSIFVPNIHFPLSVQLQLRKYSVALKTYSPYREDIPISFKIEDDSMWKSNSTY